MSVQSLRLARVAVEGEMTKRSGMARDVVTSYDCLHA